RAGRWGLGPCRRPAPTDGPEPERDRAKRQRDQRHAQREDDTGEPRKERWRSADAKHEVAPFGQCAAEGDRLLADGYDARGQLSIDAPAPRPPVIADRYRPDAQTFRVRGEARQLKPGAVQHDAVAAHVARRDGAAHIEPLERQMITREIALDDVVTRGAGDVEGVRHRIADPCSSPVDR